MYPLIVKDFMGRDDCRAVHTEGNMNAPTSGGPVTHAAMRGGQDTFAKIKEAIYRLRAEAGDVQVEVTRETGEFTGG
jgi:hypothetical protein